MNGRIILNEIQKTGLHNSAKNDSIKSSRLTCWRDADMRGRIPSTASLQQTPRPEAGSQWPVVLCKTLSFSIPSRLIPALSRVPSEKSELTFIDIEIQGLTPILNTDPRRMIVAILMITVPNAGDSSGRAAPMKTTTSGKMNAVIITTERLGLNFRQSDSISCTTS